MLLLVNDVHEKKPHRKSRQMKFWLHSHAICNLHLFYMKNALVSANQMQAKFFMYIVITVTDVADY